MIQTGIFRKIVLFLMLGCFLPAGPVYARETVRLDLESMLLSRFVWRGEMWTDDPVFWQTVTVRYKGFRAWNFFNVDLTDINGDRFRCNEYDYIFDYTVAFRSFSVAPGVLHFSSPTDFFEPTTRITLDVRVFAPLNPRLRVRIDPEKSRGSYYILSLSHRISPGFPGNGIDLYSALGISQPRYYRSYLGDQTAFTDFLLGAGVPFALGKGFTLTPAAEFTSLIERSVRRAQKDTGARKDAVTVTVGLSRTLEW
jgi:hypothetical protein